jgi:hypothetical protein
MDDAVYEKFVSDEKWIQGVVAAVGTTVAAAGSGALIGAAATSWSGPGAVVGGTIGGIIGLISGIFGAVHTNNLHEKLDEDNRENVRELAKAYANDEFESRGEIIDYIEKNGMAVGKAAEEMADALMSNSEDMLKFGQALNTAEA